MAEPERQDSPDDAPAERDGRRDSGDPSGPIRATIFGGGITGLTVAHELVERGFLVQLVEPTLSRRKAGECEVGGMAATQYAMVLPPEGGSARTGSKDASQACPELLRGVLRPNLRPRGGFQQAKPSLGLPQHFYFEPKEKDWSKHYFASGIDQKEGKEIESVDGDERFATNGEKLEEAISLIEESELEGPIRIDVIGHGNASEPEEISLKRARLVAKKLGDLAKARRKVSPEFIPSGRGASEPLGSDHDELGGRMNRRVTLRVRAIELPGEHGYRHFPAFYRHLEDTMRRTPVFADGKQTRFTAFDNLEATGVTAFALEDGRGALPMDRRRPQSFEELRRDLAEMQERLQFPAKDIGRFALKMLRFVSMSTERREAELEDVSWWDFIDGPLYTEKVQHHIRNAPKALVAMSTEETDARTHGNISVQLLLDQLSDGTQADRTLNGPTTEAWLDHWKAYLRRQGVRFFTGELTGFESAEGSLKPVTRGLRLGTKKEFEHPIPEPLYELDPVAVGDADGESGACEEGKPRRVLKEAVYHDDPHYFVLAIPIKKAQELLGLAGNLQGTLREVLALDTGNRGYKAGPHSGCLRDFSGVQLYFHNDFKFARGHVYYPNAEWGLSSISQQQFWLEPSTVEAGYLGILSVDLGEMHAAYARSVERARDEARRYAAAAELLYQLLTGGSSDGDRRLPRPPCKRERWGAVEWRSIFREYLSLPNGVLRDEIYERADACRTLPRSLVEVATAVFERTPLRASDDYLHSWGISELRADGSGGPGSPLPSPDGPGELFLKLEDEFQSLAALVLEGAGQSGDPSALQNAIGSLQEAKLRPPGNRDESLVKRLHLASRSVALQAARLLVAANQLVPPGNGPARRLHKALALLATSAMSAALLSRRTLIARTAWNSEAREMAGDTWEQIKSGLDREFARSIPNPAYFHVDQTLIYGTRTRDGASLEDEKSAPKLPVRNQSLYLINRVGQFRRLPGRMPVKWGRTMIGAPPKMSGDFYDVDHGKWVVAGSFTKTYTRLATMESSNEAGRHAVNAIVHHALVSSTLRRQARHTLQGDLCRIFDPEDHELQDLAILKRIDAALHREGLPHWMDILEVETLFDRSISDEGDLRIPVETLLKAVRDVFENDFDPEGLLRRLVGQPARRVVDHLTRLVLRPR